MALIHAEFQDSSIATDERAAINAYSVLENTITIAGNILAGDPHRTDTIQALEFMVRDLQEVHTRYSKTFETARHGVFGADERNRKNAAAAETV